MRNQRNSKSYTINKLWKQLGVKSNSLKYEMI
jgi:hypothetical protein